MMAIWVAVLISYGISTGIAMVTYMQDGGLLECDCYALPFISKMTIKHIVIFYSTLLHIDQMMSLLWTWLLTLLMTCTVAAKIK